MLEKTAVLIPYYNGEKYIDKCLSSLTCQYNDIWIIDNSEIPSDKFETEYSEINHITTKEKRLGFAKTVNYGLAIVRDKAYSHVIILNQDAYFKKGDFEVFIHAMKGNSADFFCPMLYSEDFKDIIPFVKERYFKDGIPMEEINIEDYIGVVIGGSLSLFKTLGGFDEGFFMYFEENDLFKRAKKNKPIRLIPQVQVAHRNKEESMKGEELDWFYQSERYFAKKHSSFWKHLRLSVKYLLRKVFK